MKLIKGYPEREESHFILKCNSLKALFWARSNSVHYILNIDTYFFKLYEFYLVKVYEINEGYEFYEVSSFEHMF